MPLRDNVWVIPLIVLASLTILTQLLFELLVIHRALKTNPNRRHLFLGQMLLLGVFLLSCCSLTYIVDPTPQLCGFIRFSVGFAYSIVWASLIVKCVFLLSLNNGVYLPATYQTLLLFFSVLPQVAISVQWLIVFPPKTHVQMDSDTVTCAMTYQNLILSIFYDIFLIIFLTGLSIKCRGIHDNYREASYIALVLGLVIPIWIVWIFTGFLIDVQNRDPCVAFGMLATSMVTFFVMFIPKGRQLTAMGKEGIYAEDKEDNFSTLTHSRYSPSFYLYRPQTKESPNPYKTLPRDRLIYPPPVDGINMVSGRMFPQYNASYNFDGANATYSTMNNKREGSPVFFYRSVWSPKMLY